MIDNTDLRGVLDSSIQFCDINANTNIFTDAHDASGPSPVTVKNGNTEPEGLAVFLNNPQHQDFLGSFKCIIFKSCYSANALNSDDRLASQQDAYIKIKNYIVVHLDQKFIICTSPPRRRLFTNRQALRRAKIMQGWLKEAFEQLPNVYVFDVFDLLSNEAGTLNKRYRRLAFYDQHPNKHGSEVIADELKSLLR
jgi:hypothetical protein